MTLKVMIEKLAFSLSLFLMVAWTVPGSYKYYRQPDKKGQKLSHVVVEVNGQKKIIEAFDVLTVLRGDDFKLVEAILYDRLQIPEQVNLVGYANPRAKAGEDRGQLVNTKELFAEKWAVDDDKKVFAVAVSTHSGSSGLLHGVVYIKLEMPSLYFVDVLVNHKMRVMRPGEVFILNAKDKIKINEIRTNIENSKDVGFQVVKVDNSYEKERHLRKAESFEVQFKRNGLLFAKIPMLVEGL
ncbi:MAG: hypothetical protein R3B45_06045 [Bdellovibrionota bacterium]